eukprot:CAMPEP_0172618500 /NCGR_PEP_ID=MMETSP1068-20121228/81779_1 /TAXON_ID=35684 /ORGANISM="Pseudopedinella elastica, Strain CCMP716" /LENGTH=144 /DNA_ID=CAMNT_0013424767 /DNA_START=52 /DNA_END=482 /DNA_ORIENTATION=-
MSMSSLHSAALCVLYMTVGPALVLLNKYILSEIGFKYPMLLSSLGLVFSAVTAHSLAAVGVVHIAKEKRDAVTWRFWLTRVCPIGILHAATLALGNAQYLHSGVALIQFLKAFTPLVVAALSALVFKRLPTGRQAASLTVLCAG